MMTHAQDWTTHNGNNQRNGLTEMAGPQQMVTPAWTVNDAHSSSLGMNIYSFGSHFVTSRVNFSPYSAVIECRSLEDGSLAWRSPDLGPASILYAMGFNEDAVYAHDYFSNLFYALNTSDGSVKWVSDELSYTFGPMDGVIFTCERDLIINGNLGSVDASTMCIDKNTGEKIWANANWISVTPNETKAAFGDHLYLITGAINQPKQLAAVDMRSGASLFYSEDLPGDGDQEGPIAVSNDGTIFFRRDGGDFYAVADTGQGFSILWTYTPENMGLFVMNFATDWDGNVLLMDKGKIFRLNRTDGAAMDSTGFIGVDAGRIAIGGDSTIYVNNTNGSYYAFAYDLQNLLWQVNRQGNYYAGPALSREGSMIIAGSGNTIECYRFQGERSPVAAFSASGYFLYTGESIDFSDLSSFSPASWHWEFAGGSPSVSSEQNPQGIIYSEPGVFEVTLMVSNELGSDTLVRTCYIEVELLEGIDVLGASGQPSVYPNPARSSVTISSETASVLRIYYQTGAVAYSDGRVLRERTIDISHFSPGLYMIRLEGVKSCHTSKLLVVP